jgi:hypothetical protein
LSKVNSGRQGGDDPLRRRSRRPTVDLVGGLDAAGRRMAAGANERLERGPVRVPMKFLLIGIVALAGAYGLGTLAGRMGPEAAAYDAAWVFATILYACGGLGILVGLAGLLSALVVHIVMRKERRL